jgi:hypothetical protein
MLNLDRIRTLLAGVAAGLFLAAVYLRSTALNGRSVDELGDGALLLVLVSAGMSWWHSRGVKTQDS